MIMNRIITLLICGAMLMFGLNSFAKDKTDPNHENHFKQLEPIETDDYKIEFSDVHAQTTFCLAKLTITNKTDDYLFFYTNEVIFKINDKEYSPKKKLVIIEPKESSKKTLKVVGESENLHVEAFSMEVKGINKVATNVEGVATEKFQIPANKNSFDAGGFNVNITDSKQTTKVTDAKFTCIYNGENVGIFDPSKLIITTVKGEWANDNSKSKEVIMLKGDKKKFNATFHIEGRILDMQFATMHIDWKDTFKESTIDPLGNHNMSFELDPGLTAGKNK